MEIFAPDNLPGVGMGDLDSIAAICGLLGMAVTSGMLVAQGAIGTVLFALSAIALLQEKPDFGGATPASLAVIAFVLLATAARELLGMRARRDAAALVGTAADAPETKAARSAVARRERWARRLAIAAVSASGLAVGFAWAEWNEVPFRLDDGEAVLGLVLGLIAASVGGDATWRFLQGAVRAGGSPTIVGLVVCVVAYALNVASVYIPFVGVAVFVLSVVLVARLRSREQRKFAGLRILS